ncbi:MAG: outer membrane lipoprotein carrier protein LolA [Rhizomicrobium sp.]|jgi:outer membrane lipoprotein-sorting protein
MRRLFLAVFFSVVAGSASAADFAQTMQPRFTPADQADLDRISAYLNATHALNGSFVQIGPEGQVDEGRFYIQKPGRMRFEYAPPNPTLIVSDGSTVAVINKKLNTTDRYPIWTTPLSLILSDEIDLKKNPAIIGLGHQDGQLVVNARSHSSRATGNITLVFSAPNIELRQWTVIDAQGLTTTVSVRDLKPDAPLDSTLFTIADAAAKSEK